MTTTTSFLWATTGCAWSLLTCPERASQGAVFVSNSERRFELSRAKEVTPGGVLANVSQILPRMVEATSM